MTNICTTENGVTQQSRELKYSLIWAAMWVVALMALLVLPALGR